MLTLGVGTLVSQTLASANGYWRRTWQGREGLFGSWFQEFPFISVLLFLKTEGMGTQFLTLWEPGSRAGGVKEEGSRQEKVPKDHAPVTYFLQIGRSHLLLSRPSQHRARGEDQNLNT